MWVPPAVTSFFFKLHPTISSVKVWMHDRGVFVPWSVNWNLCESPESIEHVLIPCWDEMFFWDALNGTLQRVLYITPHSIRFQAVGSHDGISFGMIINLGLYNIWISRMSVRHADIRGQPVHEYFLKVVTPIKTLLVSQKPPLDWVSVLDNQHSARRDYTSPDFNKTYCKVLGWSDLCCLGSLVFLLYAVLSVLFWAWFLVFWLPCQKCRCCCTPVLTGCPECVSLFHNVSP